MATKVKLNIAGFEALRTEPKVRDFVQNLAEEIAADSGPDVDAYETRAPRRRARSAVVGPGSSADAILLALGKRMGASKGSRK